MDCLNGQQAKLKKVHLFVRCVFWDSVGEWFLTCETSPLTPALKPNSQKEYIMSKIIKPYGSNVFIQPISKDLNTHHGICNETK